MLYCPRGVAKQTNCIIKRPSFYVTTIPIPRTPFSIVYHSHCCMFWMLRCFELSIRRPAHIPQEMMKHILLYLQISYFAKKKNIAVYCFCFAAAHDIYVGQIRKHSSGIPTYMYILLFWQCDFYYSCNELGVRLLNWFNTNNI